jgi:hypothetical protein
MYFEETPFFPALSEKEPFRKQFSALQMSGW